MEKYFVDFGDFKRTNDPAEIYVRVNENGEISDLFNMAANEGADPLADAYMIAYALNNTIK